MLQQQIFGGKFQIPEFAGFVGKFGKRLLTAAECNELFAGIRIFGVNSMVAVGVIVYQTGVAERFRQRKVPDRDLERDLQVRSIVCRCRYHPFVSTRPGVGQCFYIKEKSLPNILFQRYGSHIIH